MSCTDRCTRGVDLDRAGACIASGIGSVEDIVAGHEALQVSHRRLSPYFVPRILIGSAGGAISIRHGLRGPLHAASTACAASAHSIGDAYNFIRLGYADAMLAGGAEASVNALSVAGFHRLKALSPLPNAKGASRPFDADRRGFVMGEGAGVLLLEDLECARRRGATVVAELSGYGLSADAHHITSPSPDGDGACRSMQSALADAGLRPEQVTYVNAHATGTPAGDLAEARAIERVFGAACERLFVSSTKGATGHLLGGAGAVEAAFTAYAVQEGRLPHTLNLAAPIDARFQYVRTEPMLTAVAHAMSNSFGFGGTNCSLILSKFVQ